MSDERDKDIPAFGLEVQDTRLRQKLEAMREAIQKLMGTRGVGGGRAAVRWDDLKEGGLVSQAARRIDLAGAVNEAIGSGAVDVGNDAEPDLTKPPTPTGLAAVAGFSNVLVEWDAPIYSAGRGHKQTNVYATKQPADDNTLYTINDAVRVDSASGPLTVLALATDIGVKWRLWIRYESNDGVESDPAGGVNGVVVTVAKDGVVTNAMLGLAVIDDAKVANLSAAKLTAGDGTIGGNLKSSNYVAGSLGWMVRPDGFAEVSNIVARGTVFASAGAIGGSLIGANYIQSTNWVNLSTGWRLNNDGTGQVGGIAILSDRIQSGTFADLSEGFQFRSDGILKAFAGGGNIQFNLGATGTQSVLKVGSAIDIKANGDASYAGALSAATGTFAGALSAATGTFSGTLTADAVNAVRSINIAGDAVIVPRRGAFVGQLGNQTWFQWQNPGTRILFSTQAISFEKPGKVVLFIRVRMGVSGGENMENVRFRVLRNGFVAWEFLRFSLPNGGFVDLPMSTVEAACPTGSQVFSFEVSHTAPFPPIDVEMIVLGLTA